MIAFFSNSQFLIAGFSTIFSLFCAGYQITQHLINFHEPKYQLYIVRIILLVPIYSISSFLSLCLPESSLIFDTLRDWFFYILYYFSEKKIVMKLMFYIYLCSF